MTSRKKKTAWCFKVTRICTAFLIGIWGLIASVTAHAAVIGTEQWQSIYNSSYYTFYFGAFHGVGFLGDGTVLASGHGAGGLALRYDANTGVNLDPPEIIRYHTGSDYFYDQIIDTNGSLYFAGRKDPYSAAVWKYDFSGVLQTGWPMVHSGTADGINYGIAMDYSGFIYSAGRYDDNWHINKQDKTTGAVAAGFPLAYDHQGLSDTALSVAVDSEENFVVVGYVQVDAAVDHYDWHVRKYAGDGTLLWQVSYDLNGFNDTAYGVAVDSADNIIVSGYRNNGTVNDWYIVKYAKDGDGTGGAAVLWEQSWDDGNGRNGIARTLLVDSTDNIYVAGGQNNSTGAERPYLQYRDGQTGTLLKIQELSHPVTSRGAAGTAGTESDYITRLAMRDGQLVVAGYVWEGYLNYGRTAFITMLERVSTVTPSVTGNGVISPDVPVENVAYDTTAGFTLIPDVGYSVAAVTGTCPAGSLTDNGDGTLTYTTGAVLDDCTVVADFVEIFSLEYTAGLYGTISGELSQTVFLGDDGAAVTAIPDTGYYFVDWSDGSTVNPRVDTNVTADISVTANFAITTFSLAYAAGSNGSITGEASQTVDYGTDGSAVTAVPATGYHFVNWSDGSTANPRTDTNVTADISVTANFAINVYELTYTAGPNGSLTGATSQSVNYGADGTSVTAVPSVHYHFVNWSDGSTANPRIDTNVTADISVTANFSINIYELIYTAGPNGSLTGATSQSVNYGADGTAVTAVPSVHYHFVDWSDGVTTATRTDTNVVADISVTANFAVDPSFTLTYTAGPNGSITGDNSQLVYIGENGVPVTAVPALHYHFVDWSDGVTTATRTDTNVVADISVTANFAVDPSFTLTYTTGPDGSLTGDTSQVVYSGEDGTSVTAVPAEHYHFVDWSDGVTTATRTDTNVTADISVTANFAITTYTLNYTADVNGSLTGDTSQVINSGETGTEVIAVPDAGYHFVTWSDGVTTAARTDANVRSDLSVTAYWSSDTQGACVTLAASGKGHGAIIKTDGTLWAWGQYPLGDGTYNNSNVHIQIGTDTDWQTVSAGWLYTFAIKTDGTLWAWGINYEGQLGDGTNTDKLVPTQIGSDTWKIVRAGEKHTLAIKADGTLWAWGYNYYGQLGDATNVNKNIPVQIGNASDWQLVAAGDDHSMAIKTDGTLWAWGSNINGQLGDGTTANKNEPVQVGSATNWQTVSCGSHHTAALQNDGTLWAWGENRYGQLGDGTENNTNVPAQIGGTADWQAVTAGEWHTAALKADGTLWAWGSNDRGQLGDPTVGAVSFPIQIGMNTDWKTVAASASHTLAVTTNGSLFVWGENDSFQLGAGIDSNKNIPVQISTDTWQKVVSGLYRSFAIKADGTLWAWGNNDRGRLGDGTGVDRKTLGQIGTDNDWLAVAPGSYHTIGLKTDGTLWGWGQAQNLGNGTFSDELSPVRIGTDTDWQVITAGHDWSTAIKTDGTLWAWGQNYNGQLGDGTTVSSPVPIQIGVDTNWQEVKSGSSHTLAVKTDGTLWAWGQNNLGQLGDGTNLARNEPVLIASTLNWQTIFSTSGHTLSLKEDGSLWVWGYNYYGQLGDGTRVNKNVPEQLGADIWQAVAAGEGHSLAVRADKTLWAWGNNSSGQLGNGTNTTSYTPVQVGSALWQEVAARGNHTLAIKDDYTLWTWGANNYGQLGDGTAWVDTPLLILEGTSYYVSPVVIGNGTITPSSVQPVGCTSSAEFILTPDPQDRIGAVTGTCQPGTLFDNGDGSWLYTTGAVTENCTVRVNFIDADAFWLTYAAGVHGSISGLSPQVVTLGASGTAVTAVPDEGYDFAAWSDGVTTATRIDADVISDLSVTANFVIQTFTLSYAAGANGTVSGENQQVVALGENGTLVTAVPDAGYSFAYWSDGVVTATRVENTVTADLSVTAFFTSAVQGTGVTQVSGGYGHTVTVKTDGTLWAWGQNNYGQLGDGTWTTQNAPVQILSEMPWKSVATGEQHTTALKFDGTLWAWGANYSGQLGDGTTYNRATPIPIGADTDWQVIASGTRHVLALKTDGSLWAWGENGSGQLGNNSTADQYEPVQIGTATDWQMISAGSSHSLAVKADGSLWGWGSNGNGELGDGTNDASYEPKRIGSATDWKVITAGQSYSLAIKTDGTLWSWGANWDGQLGDSSNEAKNEPVQIGFETNWQSIAAGARHTLAVKADGTLWAWGRNDYRQLGDDTVSAVNQPIQVGSLADWQAVAAGTSHSMALNTSGALLVWGNNAYSQLGNGTSANNSEPTQVGSFVNWQAVAAGMYHTVAVAADGTLWTWGGNSYSQLGDGTNINKQIPVQVGSGTDWQKISTSWYHTAALKADGSLWTWGMNNQGQLGDGSSVNKNEPLLVGAVTDSWLAVAAGGSHTLAVKSDGTLWAWGGNSYGQLGDDTTLSKNEPVQIGNDIDWSTVSAGEIHSMALKTDGSLWAWGGNSDGQLGDGTTVDKHVPTRITPDEANWQTITAGRSFSKAIKSDGTLWAWGRNGGMELCLGSWGVSMLSAPEHIGTDTDWQTIAAGSSHTLFVKDGGTLWACGNNSYGQLGNGTTSGSYTPILIGTADNWDVISGGWGHSLAIRADGTLFTWGSNSHGQLGDGTSWSAVPVEIMAGSSYLVNPTTTGNGVIDPAAEQSVGCGATVRFTVLPDANYHLGGVTGDCRPGTLSDNGDGSWQYLTGIITYDCTVTFDFAIDTYTLSYLSGENGTISGAVLQTVDYGTDGAAVLAVPASGYHFLNWSDGSTVNPRTDTNITADITVTANFAVDIFTLTYTAGANGAISGEMIQTVEYGADGSMVMAVPQTGYHFVNWSDGVIDAIRTDANVTADITVTANFSINTYTVTSSVTGGNGTIDPAGDQTVNYGGTGVFTLTPDAGFHIGTITGSCGGVLSGDIFTTNAVSGDCTVVAAFTNQNTLSVLFAGSGAGSVSSSPPGIDACTSDCSADFAPADVVTLTASADDGSRFIGWFGEGCFGTGDCSVTMDQAREVTATFESGFPWVMFMPAITGMRP